MARRYHRNAIPASIVPLVPWAVAGLVAYFFGGKILTAIGSKVAGVSTEEFKEDVQTVTKSIASPISTAKDMASALKVSAVGYISPEEQAAAIAEIKTRLTKAIVLPYPNPQSQAEFRANIAAIDAAQGR